MLKNEGVHVKVLDPVAMRKAKDALGISFPSASAALKLMEEYGILTQQNKQRRNRTFYAKEVIELLHKPSSLKSD